MPVPNDLLRGKLAEQLPQILADRRRLHENPEVSRREVNTAAWIRAEAERAGLTLRVQGTSTVAILEGGAGPGRTFLLRADIDALPMEEDAVNAAGKPKTAVSKTHGAAHTCGHDMHTAMAMGVLRILAGLKDRLRGRVLFCFENGEEDYIGPTPDTDTGSSAGAVLHLIGGERVDACFAIHVYAGLPSGKLSLDAGPRMAGINKFEVAVRGKSGHGSRPDQAVNPVSAAAYAIANLGSAWVNEIDVTQTVTLSVCSFAGGSAFNIIPDTAAFTGSMRFFNTAEGQKGRAALERIVGGTAAMLGCEAAIDTAFMGAAVSDPAMAARFARSAERACGEGVLASCEPWFASETFSYYLDRWPGALAFLGIADPEKGSGAPHHNARFEVDESAIETGVLSTLQIITDFLEETD